MSREPKRSRHDPAHPRRHDCVAGHVGLELRNVVAKNRLEKSHRFPGNQPNSGHRDDSRLSCGVGETQLGPSARTQQGVLTRTWSSSCASLSCQELPQFSVCAFAASTAGGPLITRDQLLSYNLEVYSAGNSIQTECRTCKATFGRERWCWGDVRPATHGLERPKPDW